MSAERVTESCGCFFCDLGILPDYTLGPIDIHMTKEGAVQCNRVLNDRRAKRAGIEVKEIEP